MIENNLGKLIGVTPTVNSTTASGVFSLDQQYDQIQKNLWPKWLPTMFSSSPYSADLIRESVNLSTITMPTVQVDPSMFGVLFDLAWQVGAGRPTVVNNVPSGWTQIGTAGQVSTIGSSRLTVSWKRFITLDSYQTLTGLSSFSTGGSTQFSRKAMFVFKENNGVDRYTSTASLNSLEVRHGTAMPSGSTSFGSTVRPFIYWIVYTDTNSYSSSNRGWTGSTPTFEYNHGYGNMYAKFFIVNSQDTVPTSGTYSVVNTTDQQSMGAGWFTLS